MIACFAAAAEEAQKSKSATDRSKRGLYAPLITSPYAPAYAAPYTAPYVAPYAAPYAAPYVAPYAAPYGAPYAVAPYTSSYLSSYAAYPYGYASPYGFYWCRSPRYRITTCVNRVCTPVYGPVLYNIFVVPLKLYDSHAIIFIRKKSNLMDMYVLCSTTKCFL